jgi:hypothetical protein
MLQQRLIALGYLLARDNFNNPNDDGIFGQTTAKALGAFLGVTGPVTVVTQETFNKLWPEQAPREGSFVMNSILGGIFSGLFGSLLKWDQIAGYIRSGLIAWGTTWVTTGAITGNQLNDLVGGALLILGVVWQIIQNNINHKAMQVVKAVDAHPLITVIPAVDSPTNKPLVQVTKAP